MSDHDGYRLSMEPRCGRSGSAPWQALLVGTARSVVATALLAVVLLLPPSAHAAQDPVTFALWADTRPASSTTTGASAAFVRVAADLGKRSFGFSLGLGDFVYATSADTRSSLEAKYDSFLAAAAPIRTHPAFFIPGNHERVGSSSTARSVYHAKLGVPATRWYRIQNGSLNILMLSSVEPGVTGGSIGYYGETSSSNTAQAKWLVSTLRTIATADRNAWVLVAVHHPMHEGNSGDPWYSSKGERARLETLFRTYGVDGFLAGHIHYYRRHVEPDGITHITQGTAGSPPRTTSALPLDPYDRAALGSVYGYTLFTRGADNTLKGVTYEAYPSDWRFLQRDSFTLANRRAR